MKLDNILDGIELDAITKELIRKRVVTHIDEVAGPAIIKRAKEGLVSQEDLDKLLSENEELKGQVTEFNKAELAKTWKELYIANGGNEKYFELLGMGDTPLEEMEEKMKGLAKDPKFDFAFKAGIDPANLGGHQGGAGEGEGQEEYDGPEFHY